LRRRRVAFSVFVLPASACSMMGVIEVFPGITTHASVGLSQYHETIALHVITVGRCKSSQ